MKKHKLAFLTWLAIYPLITIIFYNFEEELMELPLALRTFLLTILLVGLMNYVIMPNLTKKLNSWLTDQKKEAANNL